MWLLTYWVYKKKEFSENTNEVGFPADKRWNLPESTRGANKSVSHRELKRTLKIR